MEPSCQDKKEESGFDLLYGYKGYEDGCNNDTKPKSEKEEGVGSSHSPVSHEDESTDGEIFTDVSDGEEKSTDNSDGKKSTVNSNGGKKITMTIIKKETEEGEVQHDEEEEEEENAVEKEIKRESLSDSEESESESESSTSNTSSSSSSESEESDADTGGSDHKPDCSKVKCVMIRQKLKDMKFTLRTQLREHEQYRECILSFGGAMQKKVVEVQNEIRTMRRKRKSASDRRKHIKTSDKIDSLSDSNELSATCKGSEKQDDITGNRDTKKSRKEEERGRELPTKIKDIMSTSVEQAVRQYMGVTGVWSDTNNATSTDTNKTASTTTAQPINQYQWPATTVASQQQSNYYQNQYQWPTATSTDTNKTASTTTAAQPINRYQWPATTVASQQQHNYYQNQQWPATSTNTNYYQQQHHQQSQWAPNTNRQWQTNTLNANQQQGRRSANTNTTTSQGRQPANTINTTNPQRRY